MYNRLLLRQRSSHTKLRGRLSARAAQTARYGMVNSTHRRRARVYCLHIEIRTSGLFTTVVMPGRSGLFTPECAESWEARSRSSPEVTRRGVNRPVSWSGVCCPHLGNRPSGSVYVAGENLTNVALPATGGIMCLDSRRVGILR